MTLPVGRTSLPELYERELVGPLFRPFAEAIVAELAPAPGEGILDIACGTGIVARLARAQVGPDARVVGVDLNPAMLEVARRTDPGIEWRQGDAGSLPVAEDERFGAVACHQGAQFFPDRAAAFREMHRALTPGGRVAVGTWRPEGEFPFLLELRLVAERHVGPIADRRHSLGDAGELEALLRAAGLEDVRVTRVSRLVRFPDPWPFVRMNAMALVGMSASGPALGEAERGEAVEAVVRDSSTLVAANSDAAGLAYELATNLATARRAT
ncbi:MAG TPA: methyltransferase domain-containing protein [Gemmatimonadales bacterium]|nr:methyltransferase domain-containing protein [Gemmatimonadales bacterium]